MLGVTFGGNFSTGGVPPVPTSRKTLTGAGFAKMACKTLSALDLEVKILIPKDLWCCANALSSACAWTIFYFDGGRGQGWMSQELCGGLWISQGERSQNPHPLSQRTRKKGGAPVLFFRFHCRTGLLFESRRRRHRRRRPWPCVCR
jgi:hypothetical protein